MANLRFKGVPFILNGEEYRIPSLSLRQFEEFSEVLTSTIDTEIGLSEQFAKFIPVILAAVKRNYPDVSEENLYDWLDLNTFRDAFLATQGASGMKAVQPGE